MIYLTYWLIGNNKEHISAIEEAQKAARKAIKEAKMILKILQKNKYFYLYYQKNKYFN